jgi:hypothetical protein
MAKSNDIVDIYVFHIGACSLDEARGGISSDHPLTLSLTLWLHPTELHLKLLPVFMGTTGDVSDLRQLLCMGPQSSGVQHFLPRLPPRVGAEVMFYTVYYLLTN